MDIFWYGTGTGRVLNVTIVASSFTKFFSFDVRSVYTCVWFYVNTSVYMDIRMYKRVCRKRNRQKKTGSMSKTWTMLFKIRSTGKKLGLKGPSTVRKVSCTKRWNVLFLMCFFFSFSFDSDYFIQFSFSSLIFFIKLL